MNLFFLDESFKKSAEYHVDSHCIKQILESCQIVCTAFHLQGISAPYKQTHVRHPSSLFAQRTRENLEWVINYSSSLSDEYTFRYGKIHKSNSVIQWAQENKHLLSFSESGLTAFPLAMPEQYRTADPVTSYRNYYKGEKQHLFKWKNREIPYWL